MRKQAFIFLILSVFYFTGIYGKNKNEDTLHKKPTLTERPFIVKFDLASPFLFNDMLADEYSKSFGFAVSGEYLFSKKSSFQLTLATYNSHWNDFYVPLDNYSIGNLHGIEVIPEFKYYVSRKKRHSGYFIGGFAMYVFEHYEDEYHMAGRWGSAQNGPYLYQYYPPTVVYDNYNINVLGVGLSNGVQFYIKKRISLEAAAGLALVETFYPSWSYLDILPRLSANIGYRFGLKKRPDPFPEIPWD